MCRINLPLLVIFYFGASSAQDFNYLTYAQNTAMNIQFAFEISANLYGITLNEEAEKLSKELTNRVTDKLEEISTAQEANQIQTCILMVSTMALSMIWEVHEQLERVHNRSVDFHQSVNRELTQVNILTIDFETFYSDLTEHLYESYYYLNDVILTDVINSLEDLINTGNSLLIPMLETCLAGVNK